MERINGLENILHKRFENIEQLEKFLKEYFRTELKLYKFEEDIDFIEDNHLTVILANYDIDIWYIKDNENKLYITEVCWNENGKTTNEDLQFYNELNDILNIYSENWEEEPLDGNEVDNLIEILRNQLNLINGNITMQEYLDK